MGIVSKGDGRYAVSGSMEFVNAAALLTEGLAAFAATPRSAGITLDLADVGRTDSAGLAVLMEWLGTTRRDGRMLCVINPPATLLALARVSELDRIILAAD